MQSTQQPTQLNPARAPKFEHDNGRAGASPQPVSSPPSSPSPEGVDRGKAVTPATVIAWLRENYKLGKHGYSKKAAVFAHYQALCTERGAEASISATFFGKLVKRAFPEIKTIRKGPRGKVEQCYDRLKPIDPAKAARSRWLERMNLYIAALNSTTPPVKEEPPPPHYRLRHQDPAREEVDHPHPHYASGLDAGHLSSLLPCVDAPSSSLSSSPAPSSPATEAGSLLHVHQQTAHQERGHERYSDLYPAHVHQHHLQEHAIGRPVAAGSSRSAYLASAAAISSVGVGPGYPSHHHHHHHHHNGGFADLGPHISYYGTLLVEPSPFYDHHSFPLYN